MFVPFYCKDPIKYCKPNVLMVAMAEVTIYGMECEFCANEFDTMDELVKHLVNEHDELWDYQKTYPEALKRIKIDGELLEELRICRNFSIHEGENLECKFCGKYFDNLDILLAHVMVDHSELFQIQVQKSNGLYLPAKFLFNS